MPNLINYNSFFVHYDYLSYSCPRCKSGQLVSIGDTFKKEEPKYSILMRREDWFDPEEDIHYQFTVTCECSNKKCGAFSYLSGVGGVSEEHYEGEQGYESEYIETFVINSFSPSPDLFLIPDATPEKTSELIKESFTLYWIDIPSAANKLRSSIDKLMDDQKISKINKKGYTISLHDRIDLWTQKNPEHKELEELFRIIKKIGNDGSHGDNVTKLHYLQCLKIYSVILQKLFAEDPMNVAKELSKRINEETS